MLLNAETKKADSLTSEDSNEDTEEGAKEQSND